MLNINGSCAGNYLEVGFGGRRHSYGRFQEVGCSPQARGSAVRRGNYRPPRSAPSALELVWLMKTRAWIRKPSRVRGHKNRKSRRKSWHWVKTQGNLSCFKAFLRFHSTVWGSSCRRFKKTYEDPPLSYCCYVRATALKRWVWRCDWTERLSIKLTTIQYINQLTSATSKSEKTVWWRNLMLFIRHKLHLIAATACVLIMYTLRVLYFIIIIHIFSAFVEYTSH